MRIKKNLLMIENLAVEIDGKEIVRIDKYECTNEC